MIFTLMVMLFGIGIMIEVMGLFMPEYMIIFLLFGAIIQSVGIMILWMRIKEIGVDKLLPKSKVGEVIWFYIRKNGTVEILKAMQCGEGFMKEGWNDRNIVRDIKSYQMRDLQVRFVPEDLGFSADYKLALYCSKMAKEHGIEGIRDGRRKIFQEILLNRDKEVQE